jgi:hypothetical protein
MRYLKYVGLFGLFVLLAGVAAPSAHAQVRFGVGIGVGPAYVPAPGYVGPPDCRYGYYGYYPYACAPYGYYGPDYFVGGVFIGAGPWFHGFRGGYYGPGYRYYGRDYDRGFRGGEGFRDFRGGRELHGGNEFRGGGAVRGGGLRGGMRGGGRR